MNSHLLKIFLKLKSTQKVLYELKLVKLKLKIINQIRLLFLSNSSKTLNNARKEGVVKSYDERLVEFEVEDSSSVTCPIYIWLI